MATKIKYGYCIYDEPCVYCLESIKNHNGNTLTSIKELIGILSDELSEIIIWDYKEV